MDNDLPDMSETPWAKRSRCPHLGPHEHSNIFVSVTLPSGRHLHMEICAECRSRSPQAHPRQILLTAE